jgi:hypothetical protein
VNTAEFIGRSARRRGGDALLLELAKRGLLNARLELVNT